MGRISPLFIVHRCIAPGWKLPKIIGSINLNRMNDGGEWEWHGQWKMYDVHAVEKKHHPWDFYSQPSQWTEKEFLPNSIDKLHQQQTVCEWTGEMKMLSLNKRWWETRKIHEESSGRLSSINHNGQWSFSTESCGNENIKASLSLLQFDLLRRHVPAHWIDWWSKQF